MGPWETRQTLQIGTYHKFQQVSTGDRACPRDSLVSVLFASLSYGLRANPGRDVLRFVLAI